MIEIRSKKLWWNCPHEETDRNLGIAFCTKNNDFCLKDKCEELPDLRFTFSSDGYCIDGEYFCELEDAEEILMLLNSQQETVQQLTEENKRLKEIFSDIVSSLDMEISKKDTLYSIRVVVDAKMFQIIKEVCK